MVPDKNWVEMRGKGRREGEEKRGGRKGERKGGRRKEREEKKNLE